ncbi:glycosyltransferase [Flavobacterium sp.]|uniref:glycosyltransferase n=1 Tax=Flavobacterium sp. TaxID=239 RepID=UPI0031D61D0D
MSKIKIVHILHSVGGVDVSLRQILENVNTLDFESIVIHGNDDSKEDFFNRNKELVRSYKLPIYRKISIKNDFISLIKALKIIRKEKPAVIHSHSTKGGVISRIIGFLTGIKVLHTPQAFSYLSTEKKITRKIYLNIEKLLSKGNSILLASSESELQRAIKEVGFHISKTKLFNNAIKPIENILELSIPKIWPDEYLCTVGRPCYQKNIEELIRVLYEINKVQSAHLVLVGVGYHSDQLESVKDLIKKLNLSNMVTLLNWTSREDVLNIVSNAKLYLSTSRYEGLPYSIIESMALGIPSVVSNSDGNRDLVKNDVNGYVVDNGDTLEFSNKVIDLLNNQEKYLKFSKNAKTVFKEKFNILERINELELIYRSK